MTRRKPQQAPTVNPPEPPASTQPAPVPDLPGQTFLMPEIVPPPPPPPPPPAPLPAAPVEDDPMAALRSIRAKCGQPDTYRVSVSRVVGGASYRLPDAGTTLDAFDLDDFGRAYGGGKYRIAVQDAKGIFIGSFTVQIAGEPRDPSMVSTPARQQSSPGIDLAELGKVIAASIAEANRPLIELLAKQGKQPDTFDTFERVASILDKRGTTAAPAGTAISQVKEVMQFIDELPNAGGRQSAAMEIIADTVVGLTEAAKPLFAAWGQKIVANINKAQQPRPASAAPAKQISNQAPAATTVQAGAQQAEDDEAGEAEVVEAEVVEADPILVDADVAMGDTLARILRQWKADNWPLPPRWAASTVRAMLTKRMRAFVVASGPEAVVEFLSAMDRDLAIEEHRRAVTSIVTELMPLCKGTQE